LIHDLGLENHISLTYKMPQEEVFEKVYHADVMLLPSIEEGIANVAVESMALGCPVISTNCGGMEELITHDKEGWIVAIRNSEGLAKQIIKFMNLDAEQIKKITKAARQKVEQQHNEEKMIKDMLNLYTTVLKY
jgi:colanic acid/amylovoran biosynthesis glycosyltransferase